MRLPHLALSKLAVRLLGAGLTIAICAMVAALWRPAAPESLGPTPVIGGLPVHCGGVPTVVLAMPDIASAGAGVIALSPVVFSLPPKLQLFIYAHECAHLVFGPDEANADCSAVRTGRDERWLQARDLADLATYLDRRPVDRAHAPGRARITHLTECYAGTADDASAAAASTS